MNKLVMTASLAALIAAPTFAHAGEKTFLGTLSGAALGGYLGSHIGKGEGQLAATGAGVFLGGALGNSIGSSLDRADSVYATRSYGYGYTPYTPTFEAYRPNYVAPPAPPPPRVIYVQPEVIEYRRVPTPTFVEEGYVGPPPARRQGHCREFTQTIKIDGHVRESYGTACLRPDGSWQIQ